MSGEQREEHGGHQAAASSLQGLGEQLAVISGALSVLGRHVLLVPGHLACPGHRSCRDSGGGRVHCYEDVGPFCSGDVGVNTAFLLVASCVPEKVAF